MKILYNNIVKNALITARTENPSYPWDEALNDDRLSRVGKFDTERIQWLEFEFDTVQTVDYVAILNHTIPEDTEIVLYGKNATMAGSTEGYAYRKYIYPYNYEDGLLYNFYNCERVDNEITKDYTRGGMATPGYVTNGTKDYKWFTDNTTKFQCGSTYDSELIDMETEYELVWTAYGYVYIQFRDSIDGITWTTWTSEVDATVIDRRSKVYRYMQFRVLFTSEGWIDTESYFQLTSPDQEQKDIIISEITRNAYTNWMIRIVPQYQIDPIQIGNIFLGTALTMPGMDISKIISRKTNSEYSKSLTGQMYGSEGVKLKYAEIPFKGVEIEDKTSVEKFSDYCDTITPFILLIWEDDLLIEPPIYCNLTEAINFQKESAYGWSFNMKFEECR